MEEYLKPWRADEPEPRAAPVLRIGTFLRLILRLMAARPGALALFAAVCLAFKAASRLLSGHGHFVLSLLLNLLASLAFLGCAAAAALAASAPSAGRTDGALPSTAPPGAWPGGPLRCLALAASRTPFLAALAVPYWICYSFLGYRLIVSFYQWTQGGPAGKAGTLWDLLVVIAALLAVGFAGAVFSLAAAISATERLGPVASVLRAFRISKGARPAAFAVLLPSFAATALADFVSALKDPASAGAAFPALLYFIFYLTSIAGTAAYCRLRLSQLREPETWRAEAPPPA
ncbi:MAG: hypothetical protein LBW85_02695 [Deltaproteobacteria bacterium]|jgi:hypothetical protein|nr:hypothetical protein [Deltaproteobacteria bacterium]